MEEEGEEGRDEGECATGHSGHLTPLFQHKGTERKQPQVQGFNLKFPVAYIIFFLDDVFYRHRFLINSELCVLLGRDGRRKGRPGERAGGRRQRRGGEGRKRC